MSSRNRGANWSEDETRVLLDFVAEHKDKLFDKLTKKISAKRKTMLWREVTEMVNDIGRVHRPWQKVRRKWFEMKSAALQHQHIIGRYAPTKNDPPPAKPWFVDAVINIIGNESDIVTEIEGGGESFVDQCDEITEEPSMQSASSNADDDSIRPTIWPSHESTVMHDSEETMEPASLERTGMVHPAPLLRSRPLGSHVGQHHTAVSHTEAMEAPSSEQAGMSHPRPVSTRLPDHPTASHHKRKRPQEECTRSAEEREMLELVTKEIERVDIEKTKLLLETEMLQNQMKAAKERDEKKSEILNIQLTTAKMEQLKLYYELKKMESELGLSGEMGVERIFKPK